MKLVLKQKKTGLAQQIVELEKKKRIRTRERDDKARHGRQKSRSSRDDSSISQSIEAFTLGDTTEATAKS